MRKSLWFQILLVFLSMMLGFPSWATDLACRPLSLQTPQSQQLSQTSCEIFRKSCEAEFAKDPELTKHIKTCPSDAATYSGSDYVLGCIALLPQPTIDGFKAFITAAASSAKKNLKATHELISACQNNPDLYRWMKQQVPVLKGTKEDGPQAAPCATVVVEFQEWARLQQQNDVYTKLSKKSLSQIPEKPQTENANPISESIFETIWKNQRQKFECLNSYGRTYLSCYYFFSVVDPTKVVGLAAKAPTLAKSFGLLKDAKTVTNTGAMLESAESAGIKASASTTPGAVVLPDAAQNVLRRSAETILRVEDTPEFLKNFKEIPRDRGPPFQSDRGIGKLEEKLGHKTQVLQRGDDSWSSVRIYEPKSGLKMGEVDAYYSPRQKTLQIGTMTTSDEFQQMGVGEALMEGMLKKFPKTEVIETGGLIQTNELILEEAMKKGMSLEAAIRETPAYKIRAKFGFTEIVPNSINRDYGFKVRRSGSYEK